MNDTLHIEALSVKTHIGAHAWEQRILQKLLLDISINTDFSNCLDQLERTIDYAALCSTITEFVEGNKFALIETVATEVARLLKTNFQLGDVCVKVSKPHAIANAYNISVSVSVKR